ncbi:hypothetical protein [Lysobacter enzymogenes]|uniref:hypothetical protein n=1 Tax=Lysobacter enzymogenes TaxID=69 RepID=UPI003D18B9DD
MGPEGPPTRATRPRTQRGPPTRAAGCDRSRGRAFRPDALVSDRRTQASAAAATGGSIRSQTHLPAFLRSFSSRA